MGSHLAIPQNGILYTNAPYMGSHMRHKANFPVSLLIASSTVHQIQVENIVKKIGNSICDW